MIKKIYYLSTCSDSRRVIKQLGGMPDFEKQEIKSSPVTPAQLEDLKELAGTYDALFSRNAVKYRTMKLTERRLSEKEIRDLILGEYTFLKRPVIVLGQKIFIGHQEKTIQAVAALLKL
jgi:arsenate reductase